jgi:hypothetical protein
VLHRIYDTEFTSRPQINEKDQIFIPTGFDSQMLINELCKGVDDGQLYEEKIKKPQGQAKQERNDIHCEDWQALLSQMQARRKGTRVVPTTATQVAANVAKPKGNKDVVGFYEDLLNKNNRRGTADIKK